MPLTVVSTPLPGVYTVETGHVEDDRGWFSRLFCSSELQEFWAGRQIVQVNQSLTRQRGAVRGLHFQYPPYAEMKLVRCLHGRVWDVVVDLRRNSPTFLRWHADELSADNRRMMVVPEGCAHGFQVLETNSEMLYLHSAAYAPEHEGGLRFDDARLNILWPLIPADLSQRDLQHALLDMQFEGI